MLLKQVSSSSFSKISLSHAITNYEQQGKKYITYVQLCAIEIIQQVLIKHFGYFDRHFKEIQKKIDSSFESTKVKLRKEIG